MYCSTERRGFDLKSTLQLVFKTYKNKKSPEQTGKNLQYYQVEWNESFVFEQKPVEIDMCNNEEETEVKERVKKTKKQQEATEKKNKTLKRQKKVEKEKQDEAELWAQLTRKFKKLMRLKKSKKKKKSKTILK